MNYSKSNNFFVCPFCFPNKEHMMLPKRFEPLSCSLKGLCATMKMSNFEKMLSCVSSHDLYLENKINKQKRSIKEMMKTSSKESFPQESSP